MVVAILISVALVERLIRAVPRVPRDICMTVPLPFVLIASGCPAIL